MAKRTDREGPVQQAVVEYLRMVMPDAMVVHVRNEINKRGVGFAIELARAKRRGVVTGFPDIVVLPFSTVGPLFLEVKAPGGYPGKTQKAVHDDLRRLGYHVGVVRSIDDVRDCLQQWGVGFIEKTGLRGTI